MVSLDRPYGDNGANMFLTYERNVIKLAEYLTIEPGGLDLAYVTSMDIDADPHLLDGASALISIGPRRVLDAGRSARTSPRPATRASTWPSSARTRCSAGPGCRHPRSGRRARWSATRPTTTPTRSTRKDPAEVTSDWRDAPNSDPESTLIGTVYEGYPVDAPFVVSAPSSWVYQGTGVPEGASFPHLVGVEYDRVDPAYPLQRPIEVLSHSPLTCDGVASYGDSAYYTHPGGAGVYNSGTMRWVEAIYGDQPHGIGGSTPAFVRAGHHQRAARLRRRPRRGQVQGARQPGRAMDERTAARSPRAISNNPQIKTIIIIPNGCR